MSLFRPRQRIRFTGAAAFVLVNATVCTPVDAPMVGRGQPLWRVDGAGWGQPAFDEVRAYFPGANASLTALDKHTGAFKWKITLPAPINAFNAVTAGGIVAVSSNDVYGLDSGTGGLRWTFRGMAAGYYDIVTDGTTIYTGSLWGRAYAIDPATGTERWMAKIPGDTAALTFTPAVGGATVYVCTRKMNNPSAGTVAALSAATGELLWSTPLPAEPPAYEAGCADRPAVGGGVVLAATWDGHVYGLDAATGAIKWSGPLMIPTNLDFRMVSATPTLGLVGSSTGYLMALDLATGTERWRARGSIGSIHDPIVLDDSIAYVNHGGPVVAYRLVDGRVVWTAWAGRAGTGAFLSAVAVDADRVYAGSEQAWWALVK